MSTEERGNEAEALFATKRKKLQEEEARQQAAEAERKRLEELELQKQQMAEEIKRLESLRAAQEMEAARNAQAAQAAQAALAEQMAKAEQAEKAAKAAQAAAEAQAAKAAKAEKEAQAARAAQAAQAAKAERAAAAEAAKAEKAAAAEAAKAEKAAAAEAAKAEKAAAAEAAKAEKAAAAEAAKAEKAAAAEAAKAEKAAAAEAAKAEKAAAAEAAKAEKAAAAEAAKAEKAAPRSEKASAKKPPIALIAGIAGGVVAIAAAVILIIVFTGNNSGAAPGTNSQSASETTAVSAAAPVIHDSGEYAGRPVYSSLDDFNASNETDPVFVLGHKVLKKENFVITRNDGTVDLNGNIVDTTVYVRNDDPNRTLTIRNGMINSDIDGSRESSADFKGNIVLEDISLGGDVWSDGHNITFESGSYKKVNNVTNIDSPGTRTITINGGSFTELAAGNKGEKYVINGGSFKVKPNSSWIASGREISDITDNSGYYTVGDAAAAAPVESAPLSFTELVSQGGTVESTYETDLTPMPLKFIIPAIFTDDGTEDYFHNFVYEYEPAGQHIILGIFLEKNDYYRDFNSDSIIEANSEIVEDNMTVYKYDDNTAYVVLQDETGLQMTIMGCREDLMVTVIAYVFTPTRETTSAVIEDDIMYVYDIIYDSLWMNLSSDAGSADQTPEWYNEDPYSDSDTQFTNYLGSTDWNNHDMTTSHGRLVGYDMPREFKLGDSADSVCTYTYSNDSSGQDMTITLEIDNSDEMNNIKPEAISRFVSEADVHGVTDVKMNEVTMIDDKIAYGYDRTLDGIQSGDYIVMYFAGVKGDMFIGLTVRVCKEEAAAKRFMDIQDIASLYMDIYNSIAVG